MSKKKKRVFLDAKDYLKFQELWELVGKVNYEIKLKERDIKQNALIMDKVKLANELIKRDINDLKSRKNMFLQAEKNLAKELSDKYGVDLSKGSFDSSNLMWRSNEAINEEAQMVGDVSMIEALEEVSKEEEKKKDTMKKHYKDEKEEIIEEEDEASFKIN